MYFAWDGASMLEGHLFKYDDYYSAFESGDVNSPNVILLIGGLGDGFLTIPYTEFLSTALKEHSIALVQILMKSSYTNYGLSSLDDDSKAIRNLLRHLKEKMGKKRVVLLGHSTGCQDILWLCSNWWESNAKIFKDFLVGGILQAPVSDREIAIFQHPEITDLRLQWAQEHTSQTIYQDADGLITAYRINSLYNKLGDDDFFSTDLTLAERQSKLSASPIPLMVSFSSRDEYFPYKDRIESYLKSLVNVWPQIVQVSPLDSDHGITGVDEQKLFVQHILKFISENSLF